MPSWFYKFSVPIYICSSLLIAIQAYCFLYKGMNGFAVRWLFAYNNPLVIISSVAFLVTFIKMDFQSQVINHLAKSSLAILLGHLAVFTAYKSHFCYLYCHYSGWELIMFWGLSVFAVFVFCIILDQLRIYLYANMARQIKKNVKHDVIFE